jgi:hypothetical protein
VLVQREKFLGYINEKELKSGETKKDVLKKRKEEQEQASTIEAIAFSILYNNIFFYLIVVALAFYIFGAATGI